MYFWNVKALFKDLKHNKLTEKDKNKYLIVFVLIYIFSFEVGYGLATEGTYNSYDVLSGFFTLLITFGGIYLCYKTNQKGDNERFLERFICLSVPITVRVLILFFFIDIAFILFIIYGSDLISQRLAATND